MQKKKQVSVSKLSFSVSKVLQYVTQEKEPVIVTNRGYATHIIIPYGHCDCVTLDMPKIENMDQEDVFGEFII